MICLHLLDLARDLVSLAAKVGRGGALVLKEAGKERLEEGAEDNLSAAAIVGQPVKM